MEKLKVPTVSITLGAIDVETEIYSSIDRGPHTAGALDVITPVTGVRAG
jgi:hypothetical protein